MVTLSRKVGAKITEEVMEYPTGNETYDPCPTCNTDKVIDSTRKYTPVKYKTRAPGDHDADGALVLVATPSVSKKSGVDARA